jgi:hypothetical protein
VVGARLAICAGVAVALLAATDSAAAPVLKLLKANPVEVRATGFHAREPVRLMVRAGQTVTRSRTRADGGGRFVATVRGAVAPRCAALVITATGSDGSRAVFRRYPQCTTHGSAHPHS